MGAPVGTTGCEGDAGSGRWFVGSAFGITDTRLLFEGDRHYDLQNQSLIAFAGYRMRSGWSVQGSVGALLGGELVGDEMPGTFDIGTGVVASVTGARRWSFGDGLWFVNGSATFALARSHTQETGTADSDPLLATDLRFGVTAGRTFAELVSPYLMARVFGGPVMWTIAGEDVTGSDTSHVQLGGGLNLSLTTAFSVVVDASVLGERSVAVGISMQL